MSNIPLHATQRPVREFERLYKHDIDYYVGGLMDYGYDETQIEEMTGLKPDQLDIIITRNQYSYEVKTNGNEGEGVLRTEEKT